MTDGNDQSAVYLTVHPPDRSRVKNSAMRAYTLNHIVGIEVVEAEGAGLVDGGESVASGFYDLEVNNDRLVIGACGVVTP